MFRRLKEFEPDRLALMSIQQIRAELLKKVKPMSEMTILNYVDEYHAKQVEKSDLAEGSKRKYRKAIKHLKEFSKRSKNDQKLLVNLDYSYADEFLIYLKSDKPHLERKGMTNSSAITIIKVFIRMFNQAFCEDKIAKNYFPIMLRNRKIKNDTQKRQGLTIGDLQKLIKKMPELSLREQNYLKQFLFLCFTGCAFNDSQALTTDNLKKMIVDCLCSIDELS